MEALMRFLYDYGTDSVSVLLDEIARDSHHPDEWRKATEQMSGLLKDALRKFAEEHKDQIANIYKQ